MAAIPVEFTYYTGLARDIFHDARLAGSWDAAGRYSDVWTEQPMAALRTEDGGRGFRATVTFDESQIGSTFRWGVVLNAPAGANRWAIVTEVNDRDSAARHRTFVLRGVQQEAYHFTTCRAVGAQKLHPGGRDRPAIRFSVWAPNAQKVDVVFGRIDPVTRRGGYIGDHGEGIDTTVGHQGAIAMQRFGSGIWATDLATTPALDDYAAFAQRPYMFRITDAHGRIVYRTDLYSRRQIGQGFHDPGGAAYDGPYRDLDGVKSCSIVVDADRVAFDFDDTGWPQRSLGAADDFWAHEFTHRHLPPVRIEDLVIYELHIGSLGYPREDPGTFADGLAILDHIADLGVNAIELLPVLEYDGTQAWGYGTSHFFALESSAGGRDQLCHFVRACHRRGIAVILDVVFNHYTVDAARAMWGFDVDPAQSPERNVYYWYEGRASDYSTVDGGYVDNGSSGWAPRYWEEEVRRMFTSSVAALLEEFHLDGVRVDLVESIHRDNQLHADGRRVDSANAFGQKLLRELTRSVQMIKPGALVIAEDHSGWPALTQPANEGGLGFDAVWYSDFCHHLVGDGTRGSEYARLLRTAGTGVEGPLAMGVMGGALVGSRARKVAYAESHDEAGNGEETARTIVVAVNGAPLVGATRRYAEARCRFAFGMCALSAGTPMFLMGEEIGAAKPFRYDDFLRYKEDLGGERHGDGRFLYRFYQDVIKMRRLRPSLHTRSIDVLYTDDANRVICFRRTDGLEDALVIGTLANRPFDHGYTIASANGRMDGTWKEIFNSDAAIYGGDDVGNGGGIITSNGGRLDAVLPMNGFVVLLRV